MKCPRCQRPMTPDDTGTTCGACMSGLPAASRLAQDIAVLPPGDPRWLELLRLGPRSLVEAQRWDELEALLTDLPFLEARAGAGLVFELLDDFALALRHLPDERPVKRILALLDEALRRDAHFIARFPTTLFQCLWNSGWWYDAPEAAPYYEPPEGGWPAEGSPWERRPRLATLLESWRRAREDRTPGLAWLCSLRPPTLPLGSAQRALIPFATDQWRVQTLAFAPHGKHLFAWLQSVGTAGSERRLLRVWDAESGREARDFAEQDVPPSDPAASPDGRWRAQFGGPAGGWGQPVRLLDGARGVVVASLATDPDINIQKVAFAANSQRLIGGGWGDEGAGEVMVWDVASRRRLAWLRPFDSVFAVSLSGDGRRAASGTSAGDIQLWDVETGVEAVTLAGHESSVQAVAFAQDGRHLASASYDGTVRIWDLERVAPLPRLRGHPDDIVDATFSTDGHRLVTVSSNCTTWIWDGENGKPVACPYRSNAVVLVGGPPRNGVYVNRRQIVSLACGAVWNAGTGDVLRQDMAATRMFQSRDIVWAPDGHLFATFGRFQSKFGTYRPESPDQPVWLEGHEGEVGCLAFSPDGRWLASGAQDQTVRVWDAASGIAVAVLRGHEGAITCVAFASEGDRIVSGGTDRTARMWEWASGTERACLRIADPGVWSSSWSSDGATREIHAVSAVAFSADSRHVLTLSERKRVRVWDPATGVCLQTLEGMGDFQAIAAGDPWQAFLRGEVLEVESPDRAVIARASHPQAWPYGTGPVSRPDSRAWAVAVGRHLHFWALRGWKNHELQG